MHSLGIDKRTAWLVVLAMIVIGGFVAAQPGPILVAPADLKWGDGPPTLPPGTKLAAIEGDPSQAGPYAYRLKLPADSKVMPHRHPVEEHVTVLSGAVYIAVGEKFDAEKGKAFPSGSFLVMPAQTPHFAWVKEETIIQVHGTGPSGLTYVNPADDPRK